MNQQYNCPQCNQADQVVPILYGTPSFEVFEKAKRKEVYLGGSVIFDGQPSDYCKRCHIKFDGTGKITEVGDDESGFMD